MLSHTYKTFDSADSIAPWRGEASGAASARQVPLCTLDSLIEKYGPFQVLEMDCEGCEYEALLCSGQLQQFEQIFLEYHYGYEALKHKLETLGFSVTVTELGRSKKGSSGSLYAVKRA